MTLIAALLAASGAHWGALRSVAWVTMTAEAAQTAPLFEAIEGVLDGDAPCQLCHFVAGAQASDKEEAVRGSDAKIHLFFEPRALTVFPRRLARERSADSRALSILPLDPSDPPPRQQA